MPTPKGVHSRDHAEAVTNAEGWAKQAEASAARAVRIVAESFKVRLEVETMANVGQCFVYADRAREACKRAQSTADRYGDNAHSAWLVADAEALEAKCMAGAVADLCESVQADTAKALGVSPEWVAELVE